VTSGTAGAPRAEAPAARIVVYPTERQLPAGFADPDAGPLREANVTCVALKDRNCIARFIVLRPGAPEALLVFTQSGAYLFEPDAAGRWRNTATASGALLSCEPFRRAVEAGAFAFEAHALPDVVVAGRRFGLVPPTTYVCPKTTP
jgi:hypothetical protein